MNTTHLIHKAVWGNVEEILNKHSNPNLTLGVRLEVRWAVHAVIDSQLDDHVVRGVWETRKL